MSEKEGVSIRIFKLYEMWRYEIRSGKRVYLGSGNDFEDAENKAFKKARDFDSMGTVHIVYEGGKPVKPATGTFASSLGRDDKQEENLYWDKFDNDWGNA
jgi:hypothetical protein